MQKSIFSKLFFNLSIIVLIVFLFVFCVNKTKKISSATLKINVEKSVVKMVYKCRDTIFYLKFHGKMVQTTIKVPDSGVVKGVIVALPGWNYPAIDWCNKTLLCEKAFKKGYVLIMPEMGKSIYTENIYKETRKDWAVYPTRKWVEDSLIAYLQKNFSLLLPGENNYIMGLSTGARGVALICLDTKDLFKKAAALSGDYDQTQFIQDNLYNGYYGAYSTNKQRWIGAENIVYRVKEFNTPIYLGHGRKDKVVSCNQTIEFSDSLKKYKPNLLVKLHIDENAEHNYTYWNSEIDEILNFFEL